MFYWITFLENTIKFTGKQLWWKNFFSKATITKVFHRWWFSLNSAKFFSAPFSRTPWETELAFSLVLEFWYLIRRWSLYGIYSLEKGAKWTKFYLVNLFGFLFRTPLARSITNEFACFCMGGMQTWNGVKSWLGVFLQWSCFWFYLTT